MKTLLFEALSRLGIPRKFHKVVRRSSVSILMYHGVIKERFTVSDWCLMSVTRFRQQMQYLKEYFEVIQLTDALGYSPKERPAVAITFDDGFRNNFSLAYPILKELKFPATVFIVTNLVDSEDTVWFCRLHEALSSTNLESAVLGGKTYDLRTVTAKELANAELQQSLKQFPQNELTTRMEAIVTALGGNPRKSIPLESPYSMLRRSEIREMVSSGLIEIGAHTMSHAILSRLTDKERRSEISGSIAKVSDMSGAPCRLFAYPNGRLQDFGDLDEAILRENGVVAAVSTVAGPIFSNANPFRLRRYGIGADAGLGEFETTVHNLKWYLSRWKY